MKELEEFAAARVVHPILDITPYGGFPYADSAFTGASVMVCATATLARPNALPRKCVAEIKRLSPQFAVERPERAGRARTGARDRTGGPVAVLNPATIPIQAARRHDRTISGAAGVRSAGTGGLRLLPRSRARRARACRRGRRGDRLQLGGRVAPDMARPSLCGRNRPPYRRHVQAIPGRCSAASSADGTRGAAARRPDRVVVTSNACR